jgi:hypothetical protein
MIINPLKEVSRAPYVHKPPMLPYPLISTYTTFGHPLFCYNARSGRGLEALKNIHGMIVPLLGAKR